MIRKIRREVSWRKKGKDGRRERREGREERTVIGEAARKEGGSKRRSETKRSAQSFESSTADQDC